MSNGIVVIGTSLGGLTALETIFSSLSDSFPLPIAVVQHRMPDGKSRLLPLLQLYAAQKVKEPQDKEIILAGNIYVAPADYHLMIEDGTFALSTEGPVLAARPSIDVLFESAADTYREKVIGVILTGASADGAKGAAHIKQRGGRILVQDPESAESGVMPRAAIKSANPDWVVPLREIGPILANIANPSEQYADSR